MLNRANYRRREPDEWNTKQTSPTVARRWPTADRRLGVYRALELSFFINYLMLLQLLGKKKKTGGHDGIYYFYTPEAFKWIVNLKYAC